MPFKSRAQQRWGHTPTGEKALGGPAKVAEWDAASKGKKLPARADKAKPQFGMAEQGRSGAPKRPARKGKR